MSNLNIFIDGSWLFKACAPERAMSERLEYSDRAFQLDFQKLQDTLLKHAKDEIPNCTSIGDAYFSTSIFELPDDLDEWPNERDNVSGADIDNVRRSVNARDFFANKAINSGFLDDAIFRPRLKGWMIDKLRDYRFQEKQVDATIVALLVKYAITRPDDVHVIITGDADVLPAIRVAYPEYSKNVFVATTHPDQIRAESRQTSYSLADFDYTIAPFILDDHVKNLISGDFIYNCDFCNKVFVRSRQIPPSSRPCCNPCYQRRT